MSANSFLVAGALPVCLLACFLKEKKKKNKISQPPVMERENRMSGSLLDFIRAQAVMDGWGDTRACPLCRDLRLHMEQELFISSSKAPRVWVGAGWELQATRRISGTCRNLTLPWSLSTSWWGER